MNILILHIKTFSLTLKFIFIAPDFEDMEVSCALGSVPTGPNVESTLTGWLIRQAVHEVLGPRKHDVSSENVCFTAASQIKSVFIDF